MDFVQRSQSLVKWSDAASKLLNPQTNVRVRKLLSDHSTCYSWGHVDEPQCQEKVISLDSPVKS